MYFYMYFLQCTISDILLGTHTLSKLSTHCKKLIENTFHSET